MRGIFNLKAFAPAIFMISILFIGCAKHSPGVSNFSAENTANPKGESGKIVEGNLIVKFHDGISPERISEINIAMRARPIKKIGKDNTYLVQTPDDVDVRHAAMKYMWFGEVIYAEPNFKQEAF